MTAHKFRRNKERIIKGLNPGSFVAFIVMALYFIYLFIGTGV
jgi:hypothetical protein